MDEKTIEVTPEMLTEVPETIETPEGPPTEQPQQLTPQQIKMINRHIELQKKRNAVLKQMSNEDAYIARKYMIDGHTYTYNELFHMVKIHKKRRAKNRVAKKSRKINRQFKRKIKSKR